MAELDIVIPVYNEAQSIAGTLRALGAYVSTPVRILICYDLPEDTTLPAIEAHRAEYPHLRIEFVRNRGRGPHTAVMSGFAASDAPFVMMYPADDDYNAALVDKMVAAARQGSDIVCASRFMRGGSMVGCPPLKSFLVHVGNWLLYHVARVPAHDSTNGFRLFSRRVIGQIPVKSTQGFTYSIELLVKAHRRGWHIAEVPAQWFERRAGKSRFNVLGWLPSYLRWCWYAFMTTYWHANRALSALVLATLLLTSIPAVDVAVAVGHDWRGVVPTFTDETFYQGHVEDIAKGRINDGNPYFMEDADRPPLVIFGGAWVNALPQLLGLPLIPALYLNFVIFSLAFAGLYYWLFRELFVPRWWATLGTLGLYLQCYAHVWRPANLQPVYPDLVLFYIGFVRVIKNPSRGNIWLLGLATGAAFYLYSYFWQVCVITLGLLFVWALATKHWPLLKATLYSSFIGGVLGAPVLLYTAWLGRAYPYFLESLSRFGLVYTHIPMAEVVYSGGWVGLVLFLLAFLWWQLPALRQDKEFKITTLLLVLSGLGLWIMQGSNALTGILLETGEHVRILILPWLLFATVVLGTYLWRKRPVLTHFARSVAYCAVGVFAAVSVYYTYYYAQPFIAPDAPSRAAWVEEQDYAAPFDWLQSHEPQPVVVWSNPHQYLSTDLPIFTRHYELFTAMGMWELVPSSEVEERYLVSLYFNPPTIESLKTDLPVYEGRQIAYHNATTIKREALVCKALHIWDKGHNCGPTPDSAELLGDSFFSRLESKFTKDIKPNIRQYLAKYHVSYILKDNLYDQAWRPELLGGVLVFKDSRYELYKLQ